MCEAAGCPWHLEDRTEQGTLVLRPVLSVWLGGAMSGRTEIVRGVPVEVPWIARLRTAH